MFEIINKIIQGITLFITTATLSISGLVPNSTQIKPSIIALPTASVSIVPTIYEETITSSPTGQLIITQKPQQRIISPTVYLTPTAIPTTDPNKGPGGIAPGAYSPDSLTQEQKQWLWKFYGHSGNAPAGYGGEQFVPTRTINYAGSSKACFTFYGETVTGDTYIRSKPITFDASCSEHASAFRWSINGFKMKYFDNLSSNTIHNEEYSPEAKIVTKRFSCMTDYPISSDTEVKIKLEVVENREYKPDSIEKIIRMKCY